MSAGKNLFYYAVNTFLGPQEEINARFDYMLANLLYDDVSNVARIVDSEVEDNETRKELKKISTR